MDQPSGGDRTDDPATERTTARRRSVGLVKRIQLLRALGRALDEASDDSLNAPHPTGFMRVSPRARALSDAAMAFVHEGDLSDAAAGSLRTQAHGRSADLLWAAALARSEGWVEENPFTYWVNELLQAAAHSRLIQHPAPEQQSLFDRVDILNDVDPERAYARLAELCPTLKTAETELLDRWSTSCEAGTDESPHAYVARVDEVADILKHIVGPLADTDDALARSRTAYARAEYHFERLAL